MFKTRVRYSLPSYCPTSGGHLQPFICIIKEQGWRISQCLIICGMAPAMRPNILCLLTILAHLGARRSPPCPHLGRMGTGRRGASPSPSPSPSFWHSASPQSARRPIGPPQASFLWVAPPPGLKWKHPLRFFKKKRNFFLEPRGTPPPGCLGGSRPEPLSPLGSKEAWAHWLAPPPTRSTAARLRAVRTPPPAQGPSPVSLGYNCKKTSIEMHS